MGALAARLVRTGPAEPQRVRQMLEAAPHRGTVRSVHCSGAAAVGVAARDDRTDAWISSKNGLISAFCGRLDNSVELARDLLAAGHPDPGPSPADVLEAA